jgi:hypothetical protein
MAMTLQDIIQEIPKLSTQERKDLIHLLVDSLAETDEPKTHSLSELRGLGADIWQGIDAQTYIDQLRDEWDHRP